MIAQQARAAVAGAAALLVLAGLWFGLAETGSGAPALVDDAGGTHAEAEALTVLSPPADLAAAHAVAEAFAIALYSDDLDGIREASTERLADRLLAGRRGGDDGAARVRVDGVTTQDAQPDRVLAFMSVLLSAVGLRGSSHGIGYGEHRSWIELPQSGPPPARYYALPLHRYVAQDVAERLSKANPEVVACPCEVCEGRSPLLLDYHDLMRHSVIARHLEINEWSNVGLDVLIERLEAEYLSSRSSLASAMDSDPSLPTSVGALADHLGKWLKMLEAL